jgi:hypothetical protein
LNKQVADVERYLAEARPNDGAAWYQQASLSRQADVLRQYAATHRLVPAWTVDPAKAGPDQFAAAHAGILQQAKFLAGLYDVAYPFSEATPQPASADDLADGEVLFSEIQCLKCHVFGDPSVPGRTEKPRAPNLQRISKRLRREWVRRWLAGPSRIQPGVSMPTLFGETGGGAFADAPQGHRERLQGLLADRNPLTGQKKTILDDGPRQIEAVAAFLYDASEKRLNLVPPSQPAEP